MLCSTHVNETVDGVMLWLVYEHDTNIDIGNDIYNQYQ